MIHLFYLKMILLYQIPTYVMKKNFLYALRSWFATWFYHVVENELLSLLFSLIIFFIYFNKKKKEIFPVISHNRPFNSLQKFHEYFDDPIICCQMDSTSKENIFKNYSKSNKRERKKERKKPVVSCLIWMQRRFKSTHTHTQSHERTNAQHEKLEGRRI
jgi:hypothetical protein